MIRSATSRPPAERSAGLRRAARACCSPRTTRQRPARPGERRVRGRPEVPIDPPEKPIGGRRYYRGRMACAWTAPRTALVSERTVGRAEPLEDHSPLGRAGASARAGISTSLCSRSLSRLTPPSFRRRVPAEHDEAVHLVVGVLGDLEDGFFRRAVEEPIARAVPAHAEADGHRRDALTEHGGKQRAERPTVDVDVLRAASC